jgi:hypothetical protein
MTPETPELRTRRAPVAQCRLCSAVSSIEAPTTEALRRSLRAFMAQHRHDGLADIVIDISDDDDEPKPRPRQPGDRIGAGVRVS